MLKKIGQVLKEKLNSFHIADGIIFNNQVMKLEKDNFKEISKDNGSLISNKKITFIDGGQAEILSGGNFCLSFIRVCGITSIGNKKSTICKKEFYVLTTARYLDNKLIEQEHKRDDRADDNIPSENIFSGEIYYESKLFGDYLIDEEDLFISSQDSTLRSGQERAEISKVAAMARRFAELSLADYILNSPSLELNNLDLNTNESNTIIFDGTLEKTFKNEDKYLEKLPKSVAGLAKSSSLFTTLGNSAVVLLNKLGPSAAWQYLINKKTSFVKLHPESKHVFRFEGNTEVLPLLVHNSSDPTFLGYPYGLILVDKLARVSREEQKSLKLKFVLDKNNQDIVEYLNTSNAHDILDNLG
ncbi:hypothetical protein HYT52_03955 [Candidatus Woesearchaeota archaeon]|nr:hypothetical protein [Candidatus Woesearchaeota archaeon]